MRRVLVYILLMLSSYSEAKESALTDMEKALISKQRENSGVFRSTPVNHIVPQFNRLTLAFDSEIINTKISHDPSLSPNEETLELNGFSFSPYLALSLKNIGLGIAGEWGEKSALYQSNGAESSNGYTEESFLSYSGMGVYLYYILFKKSKKFKLSVIGGSKLLNVKHQARAVYASQSNIDFESIKYTIQRTDLGLNLRIQIARDFALIPWGDFSATNTDQIDDQISRTLGQNGGTVSNVRRISADVDLFWRNRETFIYGLDIAAKWKRLEVRLGGAIGFLSNLNKDSEISSSYVIDDSFTLNLGFSYDFKG